MLQLATFHYTEVLKKKMTGKELKGIVYSGLYSGIWLGLLFYAIQKLSNRRLLDFLLNVDFLPLPKDITHNVFLQWTLHLAISLLLAFALYRAAKARPSLLLPLSLAINLIVSISFFPLEGISVEKILQPSLVNVSIWTAGHVLYAWILASSLKRTVFKQYNEKPR
ncbi:hypothetical protein ACFQPF_10075 [Fictibacillus iocasae]|uniref:DUF1440 domain-containing protein n=1 Tax=Fictibacillus iocasae TaxID=2715437 RepID=A0ABW2NS31_9BACL